MPPQIGDFISAAVYDSQLKSNPLHPVTNKTIACYLVDVSQGKQQGQETSFKVCNYLMFCGAFLMLIEHHRILQSLRLPFRLQSSFRSKTKISESLHHMMPSALHLRKV
jgi:hypothetical protein